jgi:hypothetical protein
MANICQYYGEGDFEADLCLIDESLQDTQAGTCLSPGSSRLSSITCSSSNSITRLSDAIRIISQAQVLIKQRRLDEEERLPRSLELRNQVGVMTGILWNNLAKIADNRSAPSLSDFEDCYGHGVTEIYTRMFGVSHPQLGAIYNRWGLALENSGEIEME